MQEELKPANPKAFPSAHNPGSGDHEYASYGMSLRDYFAGQALMGLLANGNGYQTLWINDDGCKPVSELSYTMADAMLKAREASNAN